MADNLVRDGKTVQWTNGGSAVVSGQPVVIGANGEAMIGVALVDIANGAVGEVAIEGVWRLPKLSTAVIAQGETVLFDVTGANFDDNQATPAAGDISGCCVAMAAAGNGATTVDVKLNVGVGVIETG